MLIKTATVYVGFLFSFVLGFFLYILTISALRIDIVALHGLNFEPFLRNLHYSMLFKWKKKRKLLCAEIDSFGAEGLFSLYHHNFLLFIFCPLLPLLSG